MHEGKTLILKFIQSKINLSMSHRKYDLHGSESDKFLCLLTHTFWRVISQKCNINALYCPMYIRKEHYEIFFIIQFLIRIIQWTIRITLSKERTTYEGLLQFQVLWWSTSLNYPIEQIAFNEELYFICKRTPVNEEAVFFKKIHP